MEKKMGNDNSAHEGDEARYQPQSHVLVFPFPVQGHINPMLQFSKRLVSKGLKVTVVTLISAEHYFQTATTSSLGFDVELISDGSESVDKVESADETTERFRRVIKKALADLITRIQNKKNGELKLLVYHSAMSWALDIARQHGIDGAPFFTSSCAYTSIYHHYLQGTLKLPSEDDDDRSTTTFSLPSMPVLLGFADLPSFLRDPHSFPAFLDLALSQYSNIETLKWLFICTFDKLEEEVLEWMRSQGWPVRTIGPTVPSVFLDKLRKDDNEYSLSLFKPNVELCMEWLSAKETSSVVYASFGSLSNLKKEQIEELAWGLRDIKYNFMWAIRESEMEKLPSNFVEEISGKGLVVSWCPQLQVLAHKAVRCFVTHCGWNSVMEALSFGVPMVTMPHWSDQATNAKFVADVWNVGVRVKTNEKGIAIKEEIVKSIHQVMEEEKGMKMQKASLRWKELAIEAVNVGGTSYNNIEEFVAQVKQM